MTEYSLKQPEKPDPIAAVVKKDQATTTKPENTSKDSAPDVPMGVEHFGIKGWPELLLEPKLDHSKTVEKISAIESFIKERLTDSHLKLDKDTYSQMIRDMEYELGLSDSHEPNQRVDKIYNLIRLIERTALEKAKKHSIFMLLNNKKGDI